MNLSYYHISAEEAASCGAIQWKTLFICYFLLYMWELTTNTTGGTQSLRAFSPHKIPLSVKCLVYNTTVNIWTLPWDTCVLTSLVWMILVLFVKFSFGFFHHLYRFYFVVLLTNYMYLSHFNLALYKLSCFSGQQMKNSLWMILTDTINVHCPF